MPDHRTHRTLQKLLLGEVHVDVDRWMDEPYRWRDSKGNMLRGRHRIYRHNALTPSVVFVRELLKSGDAEKALRKGLAATLHLAADRLL